MYSDEHLCMHENSDFFSVVVWKLATGGLNLEGVELMIFWYENHGWEYWLIAIGKMVFWDRAREALQQAEDWGDSESKQPSISVPAERIQHQVSPRRKKLYVGQRYVGARHRVAAREMHRRASYVVGSLYAAVLHARYGHRRGSVGAVVLRGGETVELVDYYGVSNVVHVNVVECHS